MGVVCINNGEAICQRWSVHVSVSLLILRCALFAVVCHVKKASFGRQQEAAVLSAATTTSAAARPVGGFRI